MRIDSIFKFLYERIYTKMLIILIRNVEFYNNEYIEILQQKKTHLRIQRNLYLLHNIIITKIFIIQ